MVAPFIITMSWLLMWLDWMTSRPNSSNTCQIICLACPLVGATYRTALPAGQRNASINRVVAASLDLPHRLPAATTLNLVESLKTICCHGRREKLSSAILGFYVLDVFFFFGVGLYGCCTDARDVDGDCTPLSLVFLKHGDWQGSIYAHLDGCYLGGVVVVQRYIN